MGYNRSGTRRTKRLKRAKRYFARLEQKAQAAPAEEPKGVVARVTEAVKDVASTVGDAIKSAAEKVTGKGDS